MAIMPKHTSAAEVTGDGTIMSAKIKMGAAIMSMLSSFYIFMLMAAIRESIQNACDAARRAGLTFAEGVMVELPTQSNPWIKITDRGQGMTKEFMEAEDGYMSFGSSTKAGSDNEAGGLGVGRWAVYGYILECIIATCNAFDMIRRTYIQYQSKDGTPQVKTATEVLSTATGTEVSFPLKESDVDEALRAIAWLKEIMQLTMGDSFSVNMPQNLPDMLPKCSGTVLDLGEENPELAGVRVFPMQGSALQYGRQGLQHGSIVVLTNQAAGVGGLPFHVNSPGDNDSVFAWGMIVEIPMTLNIPFMPSREALKETDHVQAILRKIDRAAKTAVLKKVARLYNDPSLTSKGSLSALLGTDDLWHWFACSARETGELHDALKKITGGMSWTGKVTLAYVAEIKSITLTSRLTREGRSVFKELVNMSGVIGYSIGSSAGCSVIYFDAHDPITLVVNDLTKSDGIARLRHKLAGMPLDLKNPKRFLFLSSKVPGEAQAAADALNATTGDGLRIMYTSHLPEVARTVIGSRVVKPRAVAGNLTYYSFGLNALASEPIGFDIASPTEIRRVWLTRNGSAITGFNADVTLKDLVSGNLGPVLKALGLTRVYVLTGSQSAKLIKARTEAMDEGLFDLLPEEFGEDEAGVADYQAVAALKSWCSIEEALGLAVALPDIQAVLAGRLIRESVSCYAFTVFLHELAKAPRMVLVKTPFEKAISPYIDVLNGTITTPTETNAVKQLCIGLITIANKLECNEDDSAQRTELIDALLKLEYVGRVNYEQIWTDILCRFPLLNLVIFKNDCSNACNDLCLALATVYRS